MSYEDARHATLCFKDWSLAFIGKVLSFLQHVDKLEKTSSLDVGLSRVIFRSYHGLTFIFIVFQQLVFEDN